MSDITYYACEFSQSKKKALLTVCYTEKKNEQSYEFILSIPHKNFCDYNAKRFKDENVDLESKALKKANKILYAFIPKLESSATFTKIKPKSFYKYIHKNHCSQFWQLWSVIRSKALKSEMRDFCLNDSELKK